MSGADVITIHPTMSPRYYGFYLQGFEERFGWGVRLSTKGFPALGDPKAGMAAILPVGQRVFIAANDFAHVSPEVLAWADVVGQVNVDPDADRPANVLPVGPSFGVPWRSTAALAAFVVRAGAMTAPLRVPAMLRDYLRSQAERTPLAAYRPGESDPRSVYFLANYWSNAPEANDRRLRFVRAVERVPGVRLDGGFWGAAGDAAFEGHTLADRVTHADYLERTRRSGLVFNTPAVHGCLGWKLGEFLALGKAIVSTPLGRVMPDRFVAGEHYHLVDDDEGAIRDAVERVLGDDHYRTMLERNARAYWERYLAPDAVAGRLVAAASGMGGPDE